MVHPSITAVGSTMHTVVEIDARDTLQELRQAYHALSETLAEEREKKRRAATTTTTQREMHGYAGAVGGGDESDVYDHVGDYGDEEEEYTVLEEVGYRAETLLESLPFLSALSVATTTAVCLCIYVYALVVVLIFFYSSSYIYSYCSSPGALFRDEQSLLQFLLSNPHRCAKDVQLSLCGREEVAARDETRHHGHSAGHIQSLCTQSIL